MVLSLIASVRDLAGSQAERQGDLVVGPEEALPPLGVDPAPGPRHSTRPDADRRVAGAAGSPDDGRAPRGRSPPGSRRVVPRWAPDRSSKASAARRRRKWSACSSAPAPRRRPDSRAAHASRPLAPRPRAFPSVAVGDALRAGRRSSCSRPMPTPTGSRPIPAPPDPDEPPRGAAQEPRRLAVLRRTPSGVSEGETGRGGAGRAASEKGGVPSTWAFVAPTLLQPSLDPFHAQRFGSSPFADRHVAAADPRAARAAGAAEGRPMC